MAEVGSGRTHRRKRQQVRRRMEAQGCSPELIEKALAELTAKQRQARLRAGRSGLDGVPDVDDGGYRPTPVDPLLRGAGRVTGQTARAVKCSKAMTKHEHDQEDRPDLALWAVLLGQRKAGPEGARVVPLPDVPVVEEPSLFGGGA